MVEEVVPFRLPNLNVMEQGEIRVGNFEAKARYAATCLIVTIPTKVARDLGIKLGDTVIIQVRKKETPPLITLNEPTSSS